LLAVYKCRSGIPLCSHESYGYVKLRLLGSQKLMILKMVD
jgi:hypothetical protein